MSLPHGIIVFGASGSGTTTFGRDLAEHLNFTHLDADDFFWEDTAIPFTVKRAREQRISKLREAIRESRGFVLSGSIVGWDEAVIPSLDLAIYVKEMSHN
jgi:adenylate kinase family enzyme